MITVELVRIPTNSGLEIQVPEEGFDVDAIEAQYPGWVVAGYTLRGKQYFTVI